MIYFMILPSTLDSLYSREYVLLSLFIDYLVIQANTAEKLLAVELVLTFIIPLGRSVPLNHLNKFRQQSTKKGRENAQTVVN